MRQAQHCACTQAQHSPRSGYRTAATRYMQGLLVTRESRTRSHLLVSEAILESGRSFQQRHLTGSRSVTDGQTFAAETTKRDMRPSNRSSEDACTETSTVCSETQSHRLLMVRCWH
jgi:hypothetical protein